MKVSYNWLKNYLDVTPDPNKVSEILTDCGLEVEGFEKIQTIKGGLEGLVIGEVLTKEKHPDADKLSVITLSINEADPLNIVCGAPNVAVGQKVVVATIGTTLYDGDDSFKIKKSKIRGQLSEGMICAEDEIGLGASHDGIMVLAEDAKIGTPAKEFFNIEDDYTYEIGLTPNRADGTGHIGVARDLVTVLRLSQEANLIKPSVDNFKIDNSDLNISVSVEDSELCPRYSGVTLSGIEVKESPDWLKNRLNSIGLTPINNIVDVTNFVLHETGQPLHAFDAANIKGNKVVVKQLDDKTKFTTLDDTERELSDKDLMICNAEEGMCIAGVFGGASSGVSNTTTSIFLESAYFNPVSIRKTAKRHGLNTDASFRYERGGDPNITIYALKRAILLMQEVAGGKVSSDIIDIYPNPIANFTIDFSYANCDRLIGEKIDRTTIKNILTALEIEIIEESEIGLQLSVPPFKVDVQREVDVIEEVLRVYGYNTIALSDTMTSTLSYRQKPDKEKITNILSDLLVANGFNEMMSNSLTKASYYKETSENLVKMLNPLSNELNVMRQTMLYNGLETIVYNQNRKSADLRLFELGKTYWKQGSEFKETNFISLFISGAFQPENWNTNKDSSNFYHLKGFVTALLERFGLTNLKFESKETDLPHLDYGLQLIVNNKVVAQLGKVKTSTQKDFSITNEVFYAELNYDNFLALVNHNKIKYKEVSKFPAVRRDLALLLDTNINYSQIEKIAKKQEKKLLQQVNLFDVYEGKNLDEGKKSYAVSFVFQDEHKTLTDKQIDKMMSKMINSLERELGAKLR